MIPAAMNGSGIDHPNMAASSGLAIRSGLANKLGKKTIPEVRQMKPRISGRVLRRLATD